MTRAVFRIVLTIAALLAPAAGCTTIVEVVVVPDAAVPDPDGGTPIVAVEHCEPTPGATWEELDVPLTATEILAPGEDVVAMHEGAVLAAGRNVIHLAEAGGPWRELSREGLPPGVIDAVVWFDGAWVVAVDRRETVGPRVFRHDAGGGPWISLGAPEPLLTTFSEIAQLVVLGDRLLLQTSAGELFALDGGTWRTIVLEADAVIMDVVSTGATAYASSYRSGAEITIFRSSDTVAWEPIAADELIDGADLVAGPGMVLVVSAFGLGRTFRLDESEGASAILHLVPDATEPGPIWIAADGTVLAVSGADLYAADALGEPRRIVPGVPAPPFTGTGAARFFHAASEGSAIILPRAIAGVGTQVLRSDDGARTLGPASAVEAPATMLELASDDRTLLVRARASDGAVRTFVLGADDLWTDVSATIPDPTSDGITGLPGRFVTRTPDYARVAPHLSSDGARSWTPLDGSFPRFDSNAGEKLRRTSSYAVGPDGLLYVGTVGGTTSICCTGSKIGWGYRPGSGIWHLEDDGHWTPVNAGIPIESGPDPSGGPPFRSDVHALASTPGGLFTSLVGRGVYRLEAGRWHPDSVGLPIDVTPDLVPIAETAAAWWPGGMAVRQGEVWAPRSAGAIASLVARADLAVRAGEGGVTTSGDLGETWDALPPLDAVELAISRDRIYARAADHRIHALAITCEEVSR